MLGLVLGLEGDGYALVSETLLPMLGDDAGIKDLRAVLCNGVIPGTALKPADVGTVRGNGSPSTRPTLKKGQYEINFVADSLLYDGRFANNGWLQETPDTLTKLTWDNAALVSIFDAEALGVKTMDVVEITVDGRKLGIAVYVMPGQPKGVITLPLGYGRTRAGAIGTYADGEGGGFDTYRLRGTKNLWTAVADVRKLAGEKYLLAMTQNHHLMDKVGYEGREARVGDKGKTSKIVRETSFVEHKQYVETHADGGERHNGFTHSYPGNAGQHGGVSLQIFQPPEPLTTGQRDPTNTPHAWGMTIDTNLCIGCAACVVACQSENNIPDRRQGVRDEQPRDAVAAHRPLLQGRRRHLRQADPRRQPRRGVAADDVRQHCENAPCEQVCPVAATVHDTEGLNVMVYNRCIGTRYCSNNCPYKVRRFNFLDYQVKDPRGSMLTAVYPWHAGPCSRRRSTRSSAWSSTPT